MTLAVVPGEAPSGERGRRQHRPRISIAVVATLLTVAVLTGFRLRWILHDEALFTNGNLSSSRVAVGQTIYRGAHVQTPRDGQSLNLTSAVPVITNNSADATIAVMVCVTPPGQRVSLVGGGDELDPSHSCSTLEPFRPGPRSLGVLRTGVVLAITPRHRGSITISGLRVSYRDGMRRGRQVVDQDYTVFAR